MRELTSLEGKGKKLFGCGDIVPLLSSPRGKETISFDGKGKKLFGSGDMIPLFLLSEERGN